MSIDLHGSLLYLDDVYTLARWMADTPEEAERLALLTYTAAGPAASRLELFRHFRQLCHKERGVDLPMTAGNPVAVALRLIGRQDVDRKLTVLFSEACGLRHEAIAEVFGKPIGKVRQLLMTGREWLVGSLLAIATIIDEQGTGGGMLLMSL